MKKKFRWDRKYIYWGFTAFCVVAAAILFYMLITRFPDISGAISELGEILRPFIWGLIIAYLLAPLMLGLEKYLFLPLCSKIFKKAKKGGSRLARGLSVFLSLVIFLLVLSALIYMILPQLYESIKTIVENSPDYIASITNWAESRLKDFPEAEEYVTKVLGDANQELVNWLQSTVLPKLSGYLTGISSYVYNVLKGVYNLLVGIVVSLYVLGNLERFKAGSKRVLYSVFSLQAAEKILGAINVTHKTFMGFISGKLLDSLIVGFICYIFCAAVSMPYALLVSILVGVTNIIPFFGPFIGAVPSALIILLVSPVKCLVFVIFVVVLQQVDGNFIGPKIIGGSTGINGFWIIFAIIVGAKLFGFWGMLLGVPVFIVIYNFFDKRIKGRLERSDLPSTAEEYRYIDHIDPLTREIVWKPGAAPLPESSPEAAPDGSKSD